VSKLHAANKTAADATALEAEVKKRISFEPFYAKTDHFTKTGSGQTQGKLLKKRRIFLQVWCEQRQALRYTIVVDELDRCETPDKTID